MTPQVESITNNVYHPSGLYPHNTVKPKILLPYMFSLTCFVKRSTTLEEQCSMWNVSHRVIKMLSKRNLIEFWNILILKTETILREEFELKRFHKNFQSLSLELKKYIDERNLNTTTN